MPCIEIVLAIIHPLQTIDEKTHRLATVGCESGSFWAALKPAGAG